MAWDWFLLPRPMECVADIKHYNNLLQEDWVYVFMDSLDDRLDKIRGDVLKIQMFPTIEQAYIYVCREAIQQAVMITGGTDDTHKAVMALKVLKKVVSIPFPTGSFSLSSGNLVYPPSYEPPPMKLSVHTVVI